MRTVSVSGARPAGQAIRGDMVKLPATPPRGVIGTGLLLLVSLFLLVAGGTPSAPDRDPGAMETTGAFILDPSITPAG
jgi:hypothetical protein